MPEEERRLVAIATIRISKAGDLVAMGLIVCSCNLNLAKLYNSSKQSHRFLD